MPGLAVGGHYLTATFFRGTVELLGSMGGPSAEAAQATSSLRQEENGSAAGLPLRADQSRFIGSTARLLSQVSKCEWQPVELPVVPEYAISCPWLTCWPGDTATLTLW